MKTILVLTCFFFLLTCTFGALTGIARAGNPCVPTDYRDRIPWTIDPNILVGVDVVLGPICRDPNIWEIGAGKYNRLGYVCDPENDPVTIELVSGTVPATILQEQPGTWMLNAELTGGEHIFVVKATDSLGAVSTAAIILKARNQMPVLY